MRRKRARHRPLSISSSHWRSDGRAKVRYASRDEALRAAGERQIDSGTDLQVYQCAYCEGWHMARRRGRPDEREG